jgi:hypothetical protein
MALPLSSGIDAVSDLLGFVEIQIAQADIGALLGEDLCIRSAHAACRSGDENVLSFEPIGIHVTPPF